MYHLSSRPSVAQCPKILLLSISATLVLLTGCGNKEKPAAKESEIASSTTVNKPQLSGVPVPNEEPSEEVLRKLEFQRYEDIEDAGGLPVTVSATNQALLLRPKLYEVRKDSCSPTPQSPPGWYECSLTIKISLAADGSDPSEQGERIGVKWDPSGEWVLQ